MNEIKPINFNKFFFLFSHFNFRSTKIFPKKETKKQEKNLVVKIIIRQQNDYLDVILFHRVWPKYVRSYYRFENTLLILFIHSSGYLSLPKYSLIMSLYHKRFTQLFHCLSLHQFRGGSIDLFCVEFQFFVGLNCGVKTISRPLPFSLFKK